MPERRQCDIKDKNDSPNSVNREISISLKVLQKYFYEFPIVSDAFIFNKFRRRSINVIHSFLEVAVVAFESASSLN